MRTNWHRLGGTPHRYLIHANTVYLWCSGTYSWTRGAQNFDLRRVRAHDRKINVRDLAEARAIIASLNAEISERLGDNTRFILLGYSLGASLAAICSLIVRDAGFHVVVRAWSPKRGLSSMERIEVEHCVSWRGDPVPWVPPWPWYAPWAIDWKGRITWPWRAHLIGEREAARERYAIERRLRDEEAA